MSVIEPDEMMFETKYLDIPVVAEILGVSRQRVLSLVNEGKLESVRCLGKVYCNTDSVHNRRGLSKRNCSP